MLGKIIFQCTFRWVRVIPQYRVSKCKYFDNKQTGKERVSVQTWMFRRSCCVSLPTPWRSTITKRSSAALSSPGNTGRGKWKPSRTSTWDGGKCIQISDTQSGFLMFSEISNLSSKHLWVLSYSQSLFEFKQRGVNRKERPGSSVGRALGF